MSSFLAGLGLGFGIGVLFAPMRGKDMREMIAVRGSELADSAADLASTARSGYEQVRSKAEGVVHTMRADGVAKTGTEAY